MQTFKVAPLIGVNTLNKIVPDKWLTTSGSDKKTIYSFIKMQEGHESEKPTWDEFEAEYDKQEALFAMELTRKERDKQLKETDWMSFSDLPEMAEEWKTYRQALRDVPNNNTPAFNENEDIINVTWPSKPE